MLLAIVIGRVVYFQNLSCVRFTPKPSLTPIYLYPLPSVWLVFLLTVRKSGMSTMRLLGNIFPKL